MQLGSAFFSLMQVPHIEEGLTSEYAKCRPETMANASLSDFVWAMSIIASRCFSSNGTLPRDLLSKRKGFRRRDRRAARTQKVTSASPEAPEGKSQGGGQAGSVHGAGGAGLPSGESGSEEIGEGGEMRVMPVTEEEKRREESRRRAVLNRR